MAKAPQGTTDQQLNTNIEVAALSIIRILNAPNPAGDTLDFIKDQVRHSLSPAQASDPGSALSADVLAITSAVVAQVYGIDLNIRNREASQTAATGADTKEEAKGFFDGLGRTPFDRRASPSGVAGFYGGSSNYSGLSGSVWRPETGIAGLTAQNFASTPFASAGLDLGTTKFLAAQGFNATTILNAAHDATALGLGTKDKPTLKAFAGLDQIDPSGRQQRNSAFARYDQWLKDHKGEIDQLQAGIAAAEDPAQRKALADQLAALRASGWKQSGGQAVDDRPALKDNPAAKAHLGTIKGKIEQINGANLGVDQKIGTEAARRIDDSTAAAPAKSCAEASAHINRTTQKMSSEEVAGESFANFGLPPEPAKPAATSQPEASATDPDKDASSETPTPPSTTMPTARTKTQAAKPPSP